MSIPEEARESDTVQLEDARRRLIAASVIGDLKAVKNLVATHFATRAEMTTCEAEVARVARTPLWWACRYGHLAVVEELASAGCSIVETTGFEPRAAKGFRRLRFTFARTRGAVVHPIEVQLQQVQFFEGCKELRAARVTSPGMSPASETATNAGRPGKSKWFCRGLTELTFHFDQDVNPKTGMLAYTMVTANDYPSRDPLRCVCVHWC
jgi:hypothetical protein